MRIGAIVKERYKDGFNTPDVLLYKFISSLDFYYFGEAQKETSTSPLIQTLQNCIALLERVRLVGINEKQLFDFYQPWLHNATSPVNGKRKHPRKEISNLNPELRTKHIEILLLTDVIEHKNLFFELKKKTIVSQIRTCLSMKITISTTTKKELNDELTEL